MMSICLVLLTTLSFVSAGWFTGNDVKKITEDDNEFVIEDGEDKEFEFQGVNYLINNLIIQG